MKLKIIDLKSFVNIYYFDHCNIFKFVYYRYFSNLFSVYLTIYEDIKSNFLNIIVYFSSY